ncbi:hypothetical protein OS190_20135 [Sulfitobacter sp. F26204]|uniref:hypothetical protein n=1 Tax=Sulfitobacter sp. F26204 TaxID=2996014 RepID=UPI00225DEB1B|nr:hypothetical protein [Sulfitobacter sp. F26204]MCX7561877.1 hypothetical protein [Sulfitobacter sp. F26204]
MKHTLDTELIGFLDDLSAELDMALEASLDDERARYRDGYRKNGPQPSGPVATRDLALPTGASMRLYTPPHQN